MRYRLETNTTMKDYNSKKYWIDRDYIKAFETEADTVFDAIKNYQLFVSDNYYIFVSNNAIRNKSNMYIDTPEGVKQVGYVLTGSTDILTDNGYRKQFIDLWVTIKGITDIF